MRQNRQPSIGRNGSHGIAHVNVLDIALRDATALEQRLVQELVLCAAEIGIGQRRHQVLLVEPRRLPGQLRRVLNVHIVAGIKQLAHLPRRIGGAALQRSRAQVAHRRGISGHAQSQKMHASLCSRIPGTDFHAAHD